MEFHDRLRKYFKENNIPLNVAGKRLGYKQANFSMYMTERDPNWDFLTALVREFPDIDMNYLLKGDNKNHMGVNLLQEPELLYNTKTLDIIEDMEAKLKELKTEMTRR